MENGNLVTVDNRNIEEKLRGQMIDDNRGNTKFILPVTSGPGSAAAYGKNIPS